jgi:hypothetical protein
MDSPESRERHYQARLCENWQRKCPTSLRKELQSAIDDNEPQSYIDALRAKIARYEANNAMSIEAFEQSFIRREP